MARTLAVALLVSLFLAGCSRHNGPETDALPVDLSKARAHWLKSDLIAWAAPGEEISLVTAPHGGVRIENGAVKRGELRPLTPAGVIDGDLAVEYPHLKGTPLFRLDGSTRAETAAWLRGGTAVIARKGRNIIAATRLQIGEALDDLYANDTPLGVVFTNGVPTISLWAPTAENVSLELYDSATSVEPSIVAMNRDDATGVWSVTGEADWNRKFYLFQIEVFAPTLGDMVVNHVTDPYSLNLATDGARSQIVNLDDADLKPEGWDDLARAQPDAPEDMAIYELHVRDFSIADETAPASHRGKFLAFADEASNGMKHLRALSDAGLTHVHLLPTFDCASIPEDPAAQKSPPDLSGFGPASEEQQAAIAAVGEVDAYNWCYDPFHYMAPDGAYASTADGPARIREFREMVIGLDRIGLGVILDVVFNHTRAAGQGAFSVLDKIVPGYYYRLDENGDVTTSTCCANTATERAMMERVMIDAMLVWAADYKVSGFRFDLMGHHSRDNILRARDRLSGLNLREDGVDGAHLYLYGEGWNFGEVANDARFIQATQRHMGERTGVGTFNDRLRDAIRGGRHDDSGRLLVSRQGFVNGLYTAPNAENDGSEDERLALLSAEDHIRGGLAGSIAGYSFINADGVERPASEIVYHGADVVGYVSDPQEAVNYAAVHDDETLFDFNAYKLPRDTSPADRVRAQNLANSLVILAQGVPLLHAGQDMLRSKSLSGDSYNSGDWFNVLDFSMQTNGWGRGLPLKDRNEANWPIQREILADPRIAVGRAEITAAAAHVREMLAIRKSSPLFRLRTGEDIMARLRFHNTGPDQIPGLIVMSIDGESGPEIVVAFNAAREARRFAVASSRDLQLHPILKSSADPIVRTAEFLDGAIFVPALTTAVFFAVDN